MVELTPNISDSSHALIVGVGFIVGKGIGTPEYDNESDKDRQEYPTIQRFWGQERIREMTQAQENRQIDQILSAEKAEREGFEPPYKSPRKP
jgi:hypothetical protein